MILPIFQGTSKEAWVGKRRHWIGGWTQEERTGTQMIEQQKNISLCISQESLLDVGAKGLPWVSLS